MERTVHLALDSLGSGVRCERRRGPARCRYRSATRRLCRRGYMFAATGRPTRLTSPRHPPRRYTSGSCRHQCISWSRIEFRPHSPVARVHSLRYFLSSRGFKVRLQCLRRISAQENVKQVFVAYHPRSSSCQPVAVREKLGTLPSVRSGVHGESPRLSCSDFLYLFKAGACRRPLARCAHGRRGTARWACGWRRSQRAPVGRRRARSSSPRCTEKRCPRRTGRPTGWRGPRFGCGSAAVRRGNVLPSRRPPQGLSRRVKGADPAQSADREVVPP
jgi:hypothetical protein